MRFIRIYERVKTGYVKDILLKNLVDTRLTEEEYNGLVEYFEEITMVSNYAQIGQTKTFEITNIHEVMEDCPLPDGTIVLDTGFKQCGEYVVLLATTKDYPNIKLGIHDTDTLELE